MLLRLVSILSTIACINGCQTTHVPKGTATVTAVRATQGDTAAYRASVLDAVAAKWKEYAEKYRTQLAPGKATAEFTLDEFGVVRSVSFVQSPEHSLFKKACEVQHPKFTV